MYKIIHSKQNFKAAIINTASKLKLNEAIVEKDFWVCLTLDYLFTHSKWKNNIAFKGGTCLSKVYKLINRFSEDIDLILDWRLVGYSINEPYENRSNTKQLKFIKDSKDRLYRFLETEFLVEIKEGLSKLLGFDADLYIDKDDAGSIMFKYPSMFKDKSILRVIKIEAGILSSWLPQNHSSIQSFISELYPSIMKNAVINLLATTPQRTFWEKITILHQEANRRINSIVPTRYSRHYYDVYNMIKKGVANPLLDDDNLLKEVAKFKIKFYPRNWARYELAKKGTLMLLPPYYSLEILKKDYEKMKSMFYDEHPTFDEILLTIKEFQDTFNSK